MYSAMVKSADCSEFANMYCVVQSSRRLNVRYDVVRNIKGLSQKRLYYFNNNIIPHRTRYTVKWKIQMFARRIHYTSVMHTHAKTILVGSIDYNVMCNNKSINVQTF